MLIRAYLPQTITALFGGLFIALGILTFGNGLLFDRLFIAILLFTACVCHKNINVLGIISILLVERIVDELLWFTFIEHFYNFASLKLFIYPILGFIIYKLWFDFMAKIAVICLVASITSEIYWVLVNYDRTPAIYWYNMTICISLLVRYMLFSRIALTLYLFKKNAQSINLDWYIYQITRVYIVIEFLNIFEYLIRHTLNIVEVQYVYLSSPYLIQSIATFTIWVVFNETNKTLKSKLIKA